MADQHHPIVIEEVTDPEELAQARAQRQRFDRNAAWFQTHTLEIYAHHRGKYICIAGEELFVAETPEPEALDISVLARDITSLFAVLVDQPGNVVCLLRQQHRYIIEP